MAHPSATSRPIDGRIWKTALTDNDSTAQETLGMERWEIDDTYGLQKYVYIQMVASSGTDGALLCGADDYFRTGTLTANQQRPLGALFGALTQNYYGWAQRYGYHDAVKTDTGDDIVDTDFLIVKASSTAGQVDRVAAGTAPTYKVLGVAVDDDINADDTVAAFLDI